MERIEHVYSIEYECPVYGVVYYRTIPARTFEEATWHIHSTQPDAVIRAISLLDPELYMDQEDTCTQTSSSLSFF
ncbi:hypothetical protein [Aneurinibacillus sp. REN35]|uniref:hypothetical protein n=1 Tax=Aneurinibacillus sp. REN35 TaxID=3237286 RepID=UPI0035295A00